jgi:type II secretory pathway predicted ATPase ExeA
MSPGALRLSPTPFDPGADSGPVYVGAAQQKTLFAIAKSLSRPNTLTLLVAPPGYGKSALIDRLLGDLGEFKFWSAVRGPRTAPAEFLRAVVLGFGFEECSGTRDQLRHVLEAFLTHQWQRGDIPALIVDDAQQLTPQLFEELCWLAALKGDKQASLSILLSGSSSLDRVVHEQAMESLFSGRIQTVQIQAFDEADTGAYISHRLANAGLANASELFDEPAVSLVYRYTGGVPALINTLCQSAMACAAAAGQEQVMKTAVVNALGQLHQVVESGLDLDDAQEGRREMANSGPELGRLIVTKGDETLTDYRIAKERVLIGRRPDSDLQLNSPGASRYHALMVLDRDGWLLIDLHSRNGTYVNQRSAQQHRLASGDVIQIADLNIQCLHELAPKVQQDNLNQTGTLIMGPTESQPASRD